jgi:DNA-binding NarL/FixJ family response regulator
MIFLFACKLEETRFAHLIKRLRIIEFVIVCAISASVLHYIYAVALTTSQNLGGSKVEVVMTNRYRSKPPLTNGEKLEAIKIDTLTGQEREIIAMVGKGLKDKQIAEYLYIDEKAVRQNLKSIFDKLEVCNRLDLVIYAYLHGLAMLP